MSTTLPAPTPVAPAAPDASPRTYLVKTLGCQMNVHDSEHMAGMLEQAGYVAATPADAAAEDADVIVINTCAVRENAADKLYGNLGRLAGTKRARPGMQIAVGGCLAQKDRAGIVARAPWVDVVFGTHNLDVLPVLLERARHNQQAEVEIAESLQVFPSTLPTRRESVYAGWVSISVGCNNTCTFCIVPHLRGKERDRRPGEVLAEVQALVQQGAIEVTLLGQNVNSYGVEFGDRGAFAKLLRDAGATDGLERLRFTSPHPAAFTDDVIEAMAATPTVMPQLHMPLQSGSDRVLRAMRRSYRAERFLGILDRVRAAMPDAAITTDIIVGFPGETEEDFAETLRVVEASRFSSAFTFQYSPRPGTPAADLPDQLPKAVVQERYERLVALQERISLEENQAQVGRTVEVLVAEGEGRKDGATDRLSGRAQDNRLVHLALPPGLAPQDAPRPGDLVTVTLTHGAPHHLVADSAATGGTFAVRRTRAGDAWAARQSGEDSHDHGGAGDACGTGAPAGPVVLGLPTIGLRGA
ncbi:tRNA (N6-isopentenyl adenosine(37)-C2)-methylthiotransferase MiaB [Cellulomonas biazotea]|uniref:tRNA-2-methylthio-N(6)-dimethylallyladenosine synthase n=1 Tax=Cellulomonas biazotea TaxID=1709 RepID=A0A402DS03_9CELL|nr:tRNA (N6-isopentenyl adenosine(37)-C2)-methylthiotransferase MiaB [Cellulomonas biazotea]GCE76856.1 tRNA-2-methylthio-N(6)-dimethylallyladenosine synthase [Cellulomonas biazotea]